MLRWMCGNLKNDRTTNTYEMATMMEIVLTGDKMLENHSK